MPNRIIKDSIRTSESLALLTAEEERHFYRLMVTADDFGRFDARPQVIKGVCYPFFDSQVTLDDISRWTQRLADEEIGILKLYEANGYQYGYFVNWDKYQQKRASKSKYPDPPSFDSNCNQVITNVPVIEYENRESRIENNSHADKSPWLPPDFFKPLVELVGYKSRDHSKAAETMKAQCEEAGVSVETAIANFAEFYKLNRTRYGWSDPVAACRRNIDKSIAKLLTQPRASPNGHHTPPPLEFEEHPDGYKVIPRSYDNLR